MACINHVSKRFVLVCFAALLAVSAGGCGRAGSAKAHAHDDDPLRPYPHPWVNPFLPAGVTFDKVTTQPAGEAGTYIPYEPYGMLVQAPQAALSRAYAGLYEQTAVGPFYDSLYLGDPTFTNRGMGGEVAGKTLDRRIITYQTTDGFVLRLDQLGMEDGSILVLVEPDGNEAKVYSLLAEQLQQAGIQPVK
jgi:hypothetical protein